MDNYNDIPRMVLADSYTICAGGDTGFTAPEAVKKSVYHIYFRRELTPWMKSMGITPQTSRFIFYGLRHIIDKIILPKVTQEEIDAADEFFTKHNFSWSKKEWQRVVDEYDGKIPIKVEALREGDVAFCGEPVIQITAENGFGDFAAWFESTFLHVWATSERATMARYWLDYHMSIVERCMERDENLTREQIIIRAQSLMADMSARSSRSTEDMCELGMASLLSLNNATPASMYLAERTNRSENPIGNLSESSLSHRIVQAYDVEASAYFRLYEFIKANGESGGSFVADCYDFENAVLEYLLPLALNKEVVIYVRPDSGDQFEQLMFVLRLAVRNNLFRVIITKSGHKLIAPTFLKVILAEGMTFERVKQINDKLFEHGYSPAHCVAYGVGAFLQQISRDNMSAAQKLAAVGITDRPVMKIAIPEKESIPGVVKVVRPQDPNEPTVRTLDEPYANEYVVYYDGKTADYRETFLTIQSRVINEFHNVVKPRTICSAGIMAIKEQLRNKYLPPSLPYTPPTSPPYDQVFLVGPSGVGKSTVMEALRGVFKRGVSHTTRKPRQDEVDGKDYYFIDKAQFSAISDADGFLIETVVLGENYGLACSELEGNVIKDIGGQSIHKIKAYVRAKSNNCLVIFLAPPNPEELEKRLVKRAEVTGETKEEIEKRVLHAINVYQYQKDCDATVVANDVETTVKEILMLMK